MTKNKPIRTAKTKTQFYYTIELSVDEAEWKKTYSKQFSLEKVANGKPETIFPIISSDPTGKPPDPPDLLDIKDGDLRLIFEDNTGNPLGFPRTEYYVRNDLLNVGVPLRVKVKKYDAPTDTLQKIENKEVYAIFRLVDQPEDTGNIKGPQHKGNSPSKTGEPFITNFINEIKSNQVGVDDDNCIDLFASQIGKPDKQDARCRELEKHVDATKVLQYGLNIGNLPPDVPGSKIRAKLAIRAIKGQEQGVATLLFRPPLIFGDNYTFEVTLNDVKGKPMTLKYKGSNVSLFSTPKITLWKKVRIHMIIYQESVKYDLNDPKWKNFWKEVQNAYNDAFIVVEEPLVDRIISIGFDKWQNYLENLVYLGDRKTKWLKYKRNVTKAQKDFKKSSFPQEGKLIPPDKVERNDATWTSWDQLGIMAQHITEEKLKTAALNSTDNLGAIEWDKFVDPVKGKRFGFCLFLCKPPSPGSTVGGRFDGSKLFYIVDGGDLPGTFVHEMGHALFLNHGATNFQPVYNKTSSSDDYITVKELRTGSRGPFFEEHYSEDMVSCVMSYWNHYYDNQGTKRTNNPVDWHFCGVCLLRLRFYDTARMEGSNKCIFRKLQYNKIEKNRPLKLAYTTKEIAVSKEDLETSISIKIDNSITDLYKEESRQLFVLYPSEGIPNNAGRKSCLDLSYFIKEIVNADSPNPDNLFLRGEWENPHPEIATVENNRATKENTETFSGDGVKKVYKLKEKPISDTFAVETPIGTPLWKGIDFEVNSQTWELKFANPPPKGKKNIQAKYDSYNESIFCALLKGKKEGVTTIRFKINISKTKSFYSEPLNVTVTTFWKNWKVPLIIIGAVIGITIIALVTLKLAHKI